MKPFFLWALFSLLLMEAFTSKAAGELDQTRFSWPKLGSGEAHTLGSGSAYFFVPGLVQDQGLVATTSGGQLRWPLRICDRFVYFSGEKVPFLVSKNVENLDV